jgi:2-polyprenyl-3-methyl-5-hydroxy-6-metoxy-1,4-benzoquinol methylase
MDVFIKPVDDLSRLINEQAGILYNKILDLPLNNLNLPEVPLSYYQNRHHERKFFSVQTASEQLYRAIILKNKPVDQLVIMEYGAGLGSLFLLAKMIGCKIVVYNDILEDMVIAANIISKHLNIPIDLFIEGDHKETIQKLNENKLECDIILSRNVIEHIYNLDDFYCDMAGGQKKALLYFSTTANFYNPAMVLFHKKLHKRKEKEHRLQRCELIKRHFPEISKHELENVTRATRGLAMNDLHQALILYKNKQILPDPDIHYTNTCDPENGNWAEHLLPLSDYQKIIESKGYKLTVLPAFWDTHYSSFLKNIFGKTMNFITKILGPKGGLRTTAFIYIIAEKNN